MEQKQKQLLGRHVKETLLLTPRSLFYVYLSATDVPVPALLLPV